MVKMKILKVRKRGSIYTFLQDINTHCHLLISVDLSR